MAKFEPELSAVFHALADPTRRAVLKRLTSGPATVSELAQPFEMALPSFVAHLRVLEGAGLVHSEKVGRVRTCHLVPRTLGSAEQWLADRRRLWENRLAALAAHVERDGVIGSGKRSKHEYPKRR